jgi:mRNA interferase YafQ
MNKYIIVETNTFKRERKKIVKQGHDILKLQYVVKKLANDEVLEDKYKDHKLSGNYKRI